VNYYNEYDKYAAQWLRNLIAEGLIPKGEVDERSIEDVLPSELAGFTQCHFFAGIGGWPLALRFAGWPADRPVWTGSCPCQPFSAAGKGKGTADERHLWPAWFHLIRECRPPVIFGEQVEAAIRHGWLDLVQADMEGIGYAFAAAGIPAAGVGAPHIRQRLWFVADTPNERQHGRGASQESNGRNTPRQQPERFCNAYRLADANNLRLEQAPSAGLCAHAEHDAEPLGAAGRMDNTDDEGLEGHGRLERQQRSEGRQDSERHSSETGASTFWNTADWLPCRDGKARPVEPGTFPLAHGVPGRVGRLRAYGNAIVPQVAAEFIKAAM